MVMIVDSAVAAEPLVMFRLVVNMDEMVESGEKSPGPFPMPWSLTFHVRQGLRNSSPDSVTIFAEVMMKGVTSSYCTASLGIGSHECFGRSLSIPRVSGVLSPVVNICCIYHFDGDPTYNTL